MEAKYSIGQKVTLQTPKEMKGLVGTIGSFQTYGYGESETVDYMIYLDEPYERRLSIGKDIITIVKRFEKEIKTA